MKLCRCVCFFTPLMFCNFLSNRTIYPGGNTPQDTNCTATCLLSRKLSSSILLYGCTTWTLTKLLEKKLDSNYTRMLRAILNNPGSNTQLGTNYTVTYHLSRKLYKLDEPDMPDTAGEARTRS